MKTEPKTKLDMKNKTASKEFDDDVMSANYAAVIIFSIYDQFAAIRKPDSGRIVCKRYIFIKNKL